MTHEYKPDFEDLCWLVGRYRHANLGDTIHGEHDRVYWLDEIRSDFGDDVARVVETTILVEDTPRQLIEQARASLRQAYAATYMLVHDAYDRPTPI